MTEVSEGGVEKEGWWYHNHYTNLNSGFDIVLALPHTSLQAFPTIQKALLLE
jgi:hypothetical protein